MIFPVLLLGAGVATIVVLALSGDDRPVPQHPPDLPPVPPVDASLRTRWSRLNQILPELRRASESSGVPLGLLVGWVAKESGGRVEEVPKLLKGHTKPERGLFQLTEEEGQRVGYTEHERLSTDLTYSINAGLALIAHYMGLADKLGVAPRGSSYFWRLVKLNHTMGSGATKKIVEGAAAAGKARTWDALEEYALGLAGVRGPQPKKWFPLVDEVYAVGKPFGFGDDQVLVVGALPFPDIPDPLDCVKV